jgi:hypothetical protein
MSAIYEFYEEGLTLVEKTNDGKQLITFVCKLCKSKGIQVNFLKIKITRGLFFVFLIKNQFKVYCLGITSNLVSHLKTTGHENEYSKYCIKRQLLENVSSTPDSKKRKLNMNESPLSRLMIASSPKYSQNSYFQNER